MFKKAIQEKVTYSFEEAKELDKMNERWPNMNQSMNGSMANMSLLGRTSLSASSHPASSINTQPKINVVNFNNNYVEAANASGNDSKVDDKDSSVTDSILNDTKAIIGELQESRTEDKLNTAFSQDE